MTLKPKIIVIVLILIVIIIGGSYEIFFTNKEPSYNSAIVKIGNIVQEVSITGQVKKGEKIKLGFKDVGTIEKVYIEVGNEVESGQKLIKLETVQLSIQLTEAQAALDLAQANLDKLLRGSTPEEIQISQTAVDNTKVAFTDAGQNLKDVKAKAQENLDADYEDALNVLDSSYLKIYNAFNITDSIQRSYFTSNDQESTKVKQSKNTIENAETQAKLYLDLAKTNSTNENIDIALSQMRESLNNIYDALDVIREICGGIVYRNTVSSADKTSLDNQKGYINTTLTNIINSQQTISLTKLTNESNINTAQSAVSSAEGALKTAQNQLDLITAEPSQEDIDLYQAQVRQAQAKNALLREQIQEATLKSPIKAQVAKINKEIGEHVSLSEIVIFLIPQEPFQIEADIPESDISKVDLADSVKITLDAFPEEEFLGKVIEIEPAETVISGVVYYKVKISLDAQDSKVKPGMTASLIIITDSKENVLIIPQRAVIEKEGKKIVRVLNNNSFKEIEVQAGLKGSGGKIEIISGLKEGDKIITFLKEKK